MSFGLTDVVGEEGVGVGGVLIRIYCFSFYFFVMPLPYFSFKGQFPNRMAHEEHVGILQERSSGKGTVMP